MIQEAWGEAGLPYQLAFVQDGEELLERLRGQGRWAERREPLPRLILLDLNMPRMDGREALEKIKTDPDLHCIPTLIFTTSHAPDDVRAAYDLGANSFLSKPARFDDLVDVFRALDRYWLRVVELPPQRGAR